MTQQNKEFVKWFDKQLDNENAFTSDEHICKQSWIAAKADNVREIAELRAKVSELDGMLGSLQSYINVLREALMDIARDYQFDAVNQFHNDFAGYKEEEHKQYDADLANTEKALASTPAKSLQAHDDEGD